MSPVHVYFFPVQFVDETTLCWVPMCSCSNLQNQGIAIPHLLVSAFAAVHTGSTRASWLQAHFCSNDQQPARPCAHIVASIAYVISPGEHCDDSHYPVLSSSFLSQRRYWVQIPVLQYYTTGSGTTRVFSVFDEDNSRCVVKCGGRFMSCSARLGEHNCSSKAVCRHRLAVRKALGDDIVDSLAETDASAAASVDAEANDNDSEQSTEQTVLLALMDAQNSLYACFRTLPVSLSWDPRQELARTVSEIRSAAWSQSAETIRTFIVSCVCCSATLLICLVCFIRLPADVLSDAPDDRLCPNGHEWSRTAFSVANVKVYMPAFTLRNRQCMCIFVSILGRSCVC